MKSTFRPTTPDDLGRLQAFLAEAFGAARDAPFLEAEGMDWRYWQPRSDWTAPRGYVMEREGEILAHAGIWPLEIGTDNGVVRGIQMIDWASSQRSPGVGGSLVLKLSSMFDFIYSIGGSEATRRVLPALGFVETMRLWRGVKPVQPIAQARNHQDRSWKLAPRLVRNAVWSIPANARRFREWRVVALEPGGILASLHGSGAGSGMTSPRPPGYFDYVLRCPSVATSFHGIESAQGLVGHFAISRIKGQARLAGAWLADPAPGAWAAAFALARDTARSLPGVNEIVAIGSPGASEIGARNAGYRMLPGPPLFLLDRRGRFPGAARHVFQLGDYDGLFLDHGVPTAYWS